MSGRAAPIPAEARAGLMRAWLEILRERHPQLMWVPVEGGEEQRALKPRLQAASAGPAGEESAGGNGAG